MTPAEQAERERKECVWTRIDHPSGKATYHPGCLHPDLASRLDGMFCRFCGGHIASFDAAHKEEG